VSLARFAAHDFPAASSPEGFGHSLVRLVHMWLLVIRRSSELGFWSLGLSNYKLKDEI